MTSSVRRRSSAPTRARATRARRSPTGPGSRRRDPSATRWPTRGPIPYVLLAASLLANHLVPPATLLIDPPVLRYVLAATLAFLPVFFANLVFTASFRDTRTADMAFASNVLGAVVGGCLESAALVIGYH